MKNSSENFLSFTTIQIVWSMMSGVLCNASSRYTKISLSRMRLQDLSRNISKEYENPTHDRISIYRFLMRISSGNDGNEWNNFVLFLSFCEKKFDRMKRKEYTFLVIRYRQASRISDRSPSSIRFTSYLYFLHLALWKISSTLTDLGSLQKRTPKRVIWWTL